MDEPSHSDDTDSGSSDNVDSDAEWETLPDSRQVEIPEDSTPPETEVVFQSAQSMMESTSTNLMSSMAALWPWKK